MKKYIKELIILIIHLMVFYLLPLTAGPTDAMGLVVLIILLTFVIPVILGLISRNRIKYLYPFVIAILFLPSVPLYYNESALIYSVWLLVDSMIGVAFGSAQYKLISIIRE